MIDYGTDSYTRKQCEECKGTGWIVYHRHLDNGETEDYKVECVPCIGSGYFGGITYTAEVDYAFDFIPNASGMP